MKNIFFMVVLSLLSGCSNTQMLDERLTQGCALSRLDVSTGVVNTNGNANICSLKCSDTLPKGYYLSVDNQQSGCKAGIK